MTNDKDFRSLRAFARNLIPKLPRDAANRLDKAETHRQVEAEYMLRKGGMPESLERRDRSGTRRATNAIA